MLKSFFNIRMEEIGEMGRIKEIGKVEDIGGGEEVVGWVGEGEEIVGSVDMGKRVEERPFAMRGITTKIKTPHGSMFVTVNFFGGEVKEVFVVVSKPGSELRACAEALGRVISLALRKGVPAEDIAETLENIKTEEVSWNKINSKSFTVSSIPDGIAKAIKFCLELKSPPDIMKEGIIEKKDSKEEKEIKKEEKAGNVGEIKKGKKIEKNFDRGEKVEGKNIGRFEVCPKCGMQSLYFSEGCYTCASCGYTKCS